MPYQTPRGAKETHPRSRGAYPRREYVSVGGGLTEWSLSNGERCGIRPDVMEALGIELGDSVRIRHSGKGIECTFIAYYEVDPAHTSEVRMVKAARDRFYADTVEDPTPASFSASVVRPTTDPHIYRESDARENGGYFETWDIDPQDNVLITAPHGGSIELKTTDLAYRLARQLDTSVWGAEGYVSAAYPRGTFATWHITSTHVEPGGWPGLKHVHEATNWEYAVSIHGFTQADIAVGGTVPIELRRQLATALNNNAAITANAVAVGPDGDDAGAYSSWWGDSADNFVNWLTSSGTGGIQIEMPTQTRSDEWRTVADTLATELATLQS